MRIRLLGGLEADSPRGEPVHFATRKTALLFAALALAGRRGVRRETLCDLFWPARGETPARNSLRQALADIRRLFPPGNGAAIHIEADLETAALVADIADGDTWLFDRMIQREEPASMALAADLYQGDLLDGVSLPEPLDQWFAPHRSAYRRKALELVDLLSRAYPAIGTSRRARLRTPGRAARGFRSHGRGRTPRPDQALSQSWESECGASTISVIQGGLAEGTWRRARSGDPGAD